MSLVTIAHKVADETNGPRPETIAGNTDPDAQKYLRLVNRMGIALMKAYAWNDLTQERLYTAPGTEELTDLLPADFDRFIPEAFWDRSQNELIAGPVGAVEWQSLKVENYELDNPKFRHRFGKIYTNPIIDSGADLAFEYVVDTWCTDSTLSVYKTEMNNDTDVAILDEELITLGTIWAWLDSEGQPSDVAGRNYLSEFNTRISNDDSSSNILVAGDIFGRGGRHFTGAPKPSRTGSLATY